MSSVRKFRCGIGVLGAYLLLACAGRSSFAPDPIRASSAICVGSLFPAHCLLLAASIRPGDEEASVVDRLQVSGRLTILENKTQTTLWLHDGDTDCLDCDETSSAWLFVTLKNGRVIETNTKILSGV